MKFEKKYKIEEGFKDLFSFNTQEEEQMHNAKVLMFKFLSEIDKLSKGKKLIKKDLAASIGTSASYITQLYRGDKLVNLLTLAKFEDIFDIEFDIKARSTKTPAIVYTISTENKVETPIIDNSKFNAAIFTTDAKTSYLKIVG